MSEDKHYTHPDTARAVIQRLIDYGDICTGDMILDPCVGKGAFVKAIRDVHPNSGSLAIFSVDIDPSVVADCHVDFTLFDAQGPYQLIVSNPPFSQAQAFVEHSLTMIDPRGTVAFLLLLQFLGSNGRGEFFSRCPPTTIDVLRPRPSFAESGATDMREYALFRWCPQDFWCCKPTLGWIDWVKTPKIRTKKQDEPVAATAAE